MKFVHALAAARDREATTWAVADGLVQDFGEANVKPTPRDFKEAAEALETAGFDYQPRTITDYWRAARTFSGPKRRKKNVSVKVYVEILKPLWSRLAPETRSNDLVAYATEFFSSGHKSSRQARAWANAQAEALDAERKAREEAEAKKRMKKQLAKDEAEMNEAIEVGDMERARELLVVVNDLRARLGMDLLKLDEEEAKTETDEEATEEEEERKKAEAEAEAEHYAAKVTIEAAIAKLDRQIAALGYEYLRCQEDLNLEDRDAYAEEIGLSEGRLALVRAQFSGTPSDDALAAALAQWESEVTSN